MRGVEPERDTRPQNGACKMRSSYSVDDLILNYDPEFLSHRFRQAGLPAALESSTGRLSGPVAWPKTARRRRRRFRNHRPRVTTFHGFMVTMPS